MEKQILDSLNRQEFIDLWDITPLVEEKNAFCIGKSCVAITSNTVKNRVYKKFYNDQVTARFSGLHIGNGDQRKLNAIRFSEKNDLFPEITNTGTVVRFWRDVPAPRNLAVKTHRCFFDVSIRNYTKPHPIDNTFTLPYNQFLIADAGFEF